MRILIIPENFRKDQYLLKPLFERLFRSLSRRRARVQVCQEPLLGGVGEALKSKRLAQVMERYDGMMDIFILCVDRDGDEGRRQRLDEIETEFREDRSFLAENAWEEIETWILAGLNLPVDWAWADVRAEVHVKEQYFDVLVRDRTNAERPDGGYDELGREAARHVGAIRQKCPDFDDLARRIEAEIAT